MFCHTRCIRCLSSKCFQQKWVWPTFEYAIWLTSQLDVSRAPSLPFLALMPSPLLFSPNSPSFWHSSPLCPCVFSLLEVLCILTVFPSSLLWPSSPSPCYAPLSHCGSPEEYHHKHLKMPLPWQLHLPTCLLLFHLSCLIDAFKEASSQPTSFFTFFSCPTNQTTFFHLSLLSAFFSFTPPLTLIIPWPFTLPSFQKRTTTVSGNIHMGLSRPWPKSMAAHAERTSKQSSILEKHLGPPSTSIQKVFCYWQSRETQEAWWGLSRHCPDSRCPFSSMLHTSGPEQITWTHTPWCLLVYECACVTSAC